MKSDTTLAAATSVALGAATTRPSRTRMSTIRSAVWLCVLGLAVWFGNGSTPVWETALLPSGVIERAVVGLFGLEFQWAGWLAAVPVTWWATGKRVEAGLAVVAGLFAAGHGIAATTFLCLIVGVGLFLELDEEQWQSQALSAAAAMVVFAFISPWAAAAGGGLVLAVHAVRKSVALPTMVVFFPSVVASMLLLVFFVDDGPTFVDAVVTTGMVCLSTPVLSLGVGGAAFFLSFAAVHPTIDLARSVGVSIVDAPIEITPALLADGVAVRSDARFAVVQTVAEGEVEIAEADGWILVDRAVID